MTKVTHFPSLWERGEKTVKFSLRISSTLWSRLSCAPHVLFLWDRPSGLAKVQGGAGASREDLRGRYLSKGSTFVLGTQILKNVFLVSKLSNMGYILFFTKFIGIKSFPLKSKNLKKRFVIYRKYFLFWNDPKHNFFHFFNHKDYPGQKLRNPAPNHFPFPPGHTAGWHVPASLAVRCNHESEFNGTWAEVTFATAATPKPEPQNLLCSPPGSPFFSHLPEAEKPEEDGGLPGILRPLKRSVDRIQGIWEVQWGNNSFLFSLS